jgi:hypothetical protein
MTDSVSSVQPSSPVQITSSAGTHPKEPALNLSTESEVRKSLMEKEVR